MLSNQYPPLKSWVITLSVAAVIFIGCTVLANKYSAHIAYKRHTLEADYLLKNTLKNIDSYPEKIQVVAIGSSLVGQGVACPSEYQDQYADVCLSKVFLNSNTEILNTLNNVGVFDSLLTHLPDILLIESDQLAYKVEDELSLKDHFFKGAYFLYNLKTTISMNAGNYRMPEYCGKIISGALSDTSGYQYTNRKSLSFNDRKYMHPKLAELSKRGVKIYLIHIPRPAITESVLHQGEQEQAFLTLMDSYQQQFQTTYIQFPEKLNFSYFYDFGHLNDVGRKKYSDWLYTQIIKTK